MPTKLNLGAAMAAGIVNTYKLDKKDQYVMVVLQNEGDPFVIPMINNEAGAIAYIDTSVDVKNTVTLQNLIREVGEQKIYKGMYIFTALKAEAPEHSMTIKEFMKPVCGVKGEGADEILKKAGYTLPVKSGVGFAFGKRDYSKLMKDNKEAKEIYDENHEMLVKAGATFEGLDTESKVAYDGIEAGTSQGIIFEGPTGTGKSWAAKILADHANAPLLNLQITYGTTIEDLVGQFIPNDKAADEGAAKWIFVPGPLLRAYYEGWQIVIEEINYGQPGVNAKLNEFTDGTPRITVNGKSYKRHPNFVCYMTMNPGYEGTEPLNVALKNRFAKVNIPALNVKEYIKRLCAYSKMLGHELKEEFFHKLYDFANFVEKEACSSKWHENVKFSIRNGQRLCDCILQKTRSIEEFADAIAVQYLNDLSNDNDNSDKLEALKKDKDIKMKIKELYELYDFAETKESKVTKSLADCIEEDSDTSDHKAKKEKMVDDLFEHFKYAKPEIK